MPSTPETIQRAGDARALRSQGKTESQIAEELGCSVTLIKEYLEKNGHPLDCPTCNGLGVSKHRSSGERRPICDKS